MFNFMDRVYVDYEGKSGPATVIYHKNNNLFVRFDALFGWDVFNKEESKFGPSKNRLTILGGHPLLMEC